MTLAAVARTLARSTPTDLARETASEAEAAALAVTDSARRAIALGAVTEAHAANGNSQQARRTASVACVTGNWMQMLRVVLPLDPSAVSVLADH